MIDLVGACRKYFRYKEHDMVRQLSREEIERCLREQQALVDKAIAEAHDLGLNDAINVSWERLLEREKAKEVLKVLDEVGHIVLKHTTRMPVLILKISNEIMKLRKKYADRAKGSNPYDDGYDASRLLKKTPELTAAINRKHRREAKARKYDRKYDS